MLFNPFNQHGPCPGSAVVTVIRWCFVSQECNEMSIATVFSNSLNKPAIRNQPEKIIYILNASTAKVKAFQIGEIPSMKSD